MWQAILIANRGEIVERVIKTCHELEIETVAVYSTADAKAPFVSKATQSICIGPAAANKSYLQPDNILQAMSISGAQALHPGYGFLSENAQFAQAVLDAGHVWLGPSPSCVHQMGDKLESKAVAVQAGVATVPGHDGVVETLSQALQLCNETIGYPVLLKALAGGGGKGMRVCYNDQDVKDAWTVSKAEALSFFNNDQLLLEKFIERPHHIEFQVLCGRKENGDLDVVVFPERECSIQRRNQKVIEESPSCLLTPETRQTMAEQVVRLCQATQYQSAGTVEFLVDEEQNFFFLEMNSRLQVEHPVTEAITGVDLVKGMLYVGAGWPLPDEFQRDGIIMPHKGHAVEARIYAEDPLRGFLPSTGPLSPYVEPSSAQNTPESYVRVESGVATGHLVSPYYDPMLSKVIYYDQTRAGAIAGLSQALDEYVIESVQHNARLVQSVLREPEFLKGNTPTSFLPTHYPDGFKGVKLGTSDLQELAAAAAVISDVRRTHFDRPSLGGQPNNSEVVVEQYLCDMTIDGVSRSVQVLGESNEGELKLQMYGADVIVTIQSEREYELSAHMHEPLKIDTSSLILSPMPGTLISYAVDEGDYVEEGQELCVVEAMKMQNLIRAPRAGTIGKCKVTVGNSLQADQLIMEYAKDDIHEAAAQALLAQKTNVVAGQDHL
ncbi:carboxylase propionyl-coa carboxylase [Phaeodactylum tricornutum CCAP 1055/1]|uniref:propionyl-CoA carboxylase n=2 Tax=Phaeodactylum tricornutum TaxID=2850 RepID=B7GCL6_PHATC|nr:carboxylase propionyl-coa carboxylase [Phaeodactylum tricornutum CCAP 1055/1]EEC43566.1 carboxylase propionyl-coa carboxylase [Phaeodactylum tricornutum CCAP 1055/1]|eukprot:XP_002184830.1 carboxylase propionyl-coa carboxylase [Phaeodactylum tricornutum CCAP 1055/1]